LSAGRGAFCRARLRAGRTAANDAAQAGILQGDSPEYRPPGARPTLRLRRLRRLAGRALGGAGVHHGLSLYFCTRAVSSLVDRSSFWMAWSWLAVSTAFDLGVQGGHFTGGGVAVFTQALDPFHCQQRSLAWAVVKASRAPAFQLKQFIPPPVYFSPVWFGEIGQRGRLGELLEALAQGSWIAEQAARPKNQDKSG